MANWKKLREEYFSVVEGLTVEDWKNLDKTIEVKKEIRKAELELGWILHIGQLLSGQYATEDNKTLSLVIGGAIESSTRASINLELRPEELIGVSLKDLYPIAA